MDKFKRRNIQYKYIAKYIAKKYIKTYPDDYYIIGLIYRLILYNYKLMHENLNKSIKLGNTKALIYLGDMYYWGSLYNDLSITKATQYYDEAIIKGDTYAYSKYANIYINSEYYYDANKLIINLNKAVESGDLNALIQLGKYYGSINEITKMMEYYNKAIKLGETQAMVNISIYYKRIKDYNNMIKYANMAIKLNSTYCISILCEFYIKSISII